MWPKIANTLCVNNVRAISYRKCSLTEKPILWKNSVV